MVMYAFNLFTLSNCIFDVMRGKDVLFNTTLGLVIFFGGVCAVELSIESLTNGQKAK